MKEFWLSIHIIGVIIGAGAVSTAYARELYFKWHPKELAQKGSLPIITFLINLGLGILIISGFGLYLINPGYYNNSSEFITKLVLVGLLIANHLTLNIYLRPNFKKLPKIAIASDYFSLIAWYGITIYSIFI